MDEIQLGEHYTDSLTGFTGTATARCVYLDDAASVFLEGVDAKGDPSGHWVNEARLERETQSLGLTAWFTP